MLKFLRKRRTGSKKPERRKNHRLRQKLKNNDAAVKANRRASRELQAAAKEMAIATINGDLKWMRRSELLNDSDLKSGESENDGRGIGCLPNHSCQHGN